MAGIGFRLRALVNNGSYLEATTAYLSSAIISTGPWLASALALVMLSNWTEAELTAPERALLFATLISVFAASLLFASGPQMLLMRYLADRIYASDFASIAPTCSGVLLLNVPAVLLVLPFLCLAPFPLLYRLLVGTLFLTLTMVWLITPFLSAARGYRRLVLIYTLSYACGTGAALCLAHLAGIAGILAGFTFGQVLCLSLLLGSIYREFPSSQGFSLAYLGYLPRYWELWLIGFFYALGNWIDSLIFWFSTRGEVVGGFYHLFAPYDSARFLTYLTTIPVAALFMIHLETRFYSHYSHFYFFIRNKGTLADLIQARTKMLASVRKGALSILKVQGTISLFVCVVTRDLARFLHLAPRWVPLLRLSACAGPGQFLLLCMVLFLLYLDQRRFALLVVAFFALSNAGLTLASLALGESWYGAGSLVAAWAGAILGWSLLMNHLRQLECQTFMNQPVK